ncbi:MAG: hypothetical protein HKN16_02475 [Saprospiraceae bacterium]|nr:hypothetical protein [Saprospiraceae bacterium]
MRKQLFKTIFTLVFFSLATLAISETNVSIEPRVGGSDLPENSSITGEIVVSVPAKNAIGQNKWFDTGVALKNGSSITINSTGTWRLGPGPRACNGNGLTNFPPFKGHLYGTLMAKIGRNGKPFKIGANYQGKANATGRLFLGNNDSNSADNSGSLTVSIKYGNLAPPSMIEKIVDVPAKKSIGENKWFDTGITVQNGTSLTINSTGTWRLGPGPRACNGNGLTNFPPFKGHLYGTLMGKIGKNGKPFKIGANYQGNANATGRLFLGNNDSNSADNSGSLRVSIRYGNLAPPSMIEKVVDVPAKKSIGENKWFDTGITLQNGSPLTLNSTGTWRLGPGPRACNGNGLTNFPPFKGHLYGTLMAKIGKNGKPFKIGANYQGKANATGRLFLGNNDSNSGDNSGSLRVSIKYGSTAPPTGVDKVVSVPAKNAIGQNKWFDTGVAVQNGSSITINSTGTWRLGPGPRECNGNGLSNFPPFKGHLYGTLMAKIGKNGKPFKIGANYQGKANATGRLFLGNNDSNSADNSGNITASINIR